MRLLGKCVGIAVISFNRRTFDTFSPLSLAPRKSLAILDVSLELN